MNGCKRGYFPALFRNQGSRLLDMLEKTSFLQHLNGQVFLSHHQAVQHLLDAEVQVARNSPEFLDFQI